jgi:sulfate adenylyltransferase
MTNPLVPPHGGRLNPLLVEGKEIEEEKLKAQALPQVELSSRETSDLIMMAIGAFSPLEGFMDEESYLSVVDKMRLVDGTLWPIPITLSVNQDKADGIPTGSQIALIDGESKVLMGTMTVEEKFMYDKKHEAKLVFRTEEKAHPGVAKVYAQEDILLAGPV